MRLYGRNRVLQHQYSTHTHTHTHIEKEKKKEKIEERKRGERPCCLLNQYWCCWMFFFIMFFIFFYFWKDSFEIPVQFWRILYRVPINRSRRNPEEHPISDVNGSRIPWIWKEWKGIPKICRNPSNTLQESKNLFENPTNGLVALGRMFSLVKMPM